MAWKEVADTLEVVELTHKLRTHTRRLIHKFSLATGISNPWTSIDFHRAPGSLIYKDRDSPLDRLLPLYIRNSLKLGQDTGYTQITIDIMEL
jgi:hypothetical protein